MLSFSLKVSPLCSTLLKHQSAHKQVLGSNTLYTHRLPLTDKHLPTAAAHHCVEPYFSSVSLEPLYYFTHQHGDLCHLVSDFHPATLKEGRKIHSGTGQHFGRDGLGSAAVLFVYIFAKCISQRQEMPTPEVLQKLLMLIFSVPSLLCP